MSNDGISIYIEKTGNDQFKLFDDGDLTYSYETHGEDVESGPIHKAIKDILNGTGYELNEGIIYGYASGSELEKEIIRLTGLLNQCIGVYYGINAKIQEVTNL